MRDKIKKLINSEKGPTKIKLTLYMLFLIFVLLFILVSGGFERADSPKSGKEDSKVEAEESLSLGDKQKILISEDHSYTYTIKAKDLIIYNGKIENGIDTGYRETKDDIIKYKIVNNVIYKISGITEEEYKELYKDIDESLLSLTNIFDTLNDASAIINRDDNSTLYEYNIDGKNYKIYADNKVINKIEIKFDTQEYTYEFKY